MKKKWIAAAVGLGSLSVYLAQSSLNENLYENFRIFSEATKGVIEFFNDNLTKYVNWSGSESVKNYEQAINYSLEKISMISKQVDMQLFIPLAMIGFAIFLPLIIYKLTK